MTVENKIETKTVEFYEVPNGEVFMHDDKCYLAIEELRSDSWGNFKNAVDLSDGELVYFDSDEEVIWVKATLIIESR